MLGVEQEVGLKTANFDLCTWTFDYSIRKVQNTKYKDLLFTI